MTSEIHVCEWYDARSHVWLTAPIAYSLATLERMLLLLFEI